MLLRSAAGGSVVTSRAVVAGGLRVLVVLETERRGRQEQSCQAKNRHESVEWAIHLFEFDALAMQKIHLPLNYLLLQSYSEGQVCSRRGEEET